MAQLYPDVVLPAPRPSRRRRRRSTVPPLSVGSTSDPNLGDGPRPSAGERRRARRRSIRQSQQFWESTDTPLTGSVSVGGRAIAGPTAVTLARTGRTIVTTPQLANLLGGRAATAARQQFALSTDTDILDPVVAQQESVLDALLSKADRNELEDNTAVELIREYKPKRYRDLLFQHEAKKAGAKPADLGLETRPEQQEWLRRIYADNRARRVNALAESGAIEHPNMPGGLERFVGDLIPDEPWEIGLAAGTLGAGTLVTGAARGGAAALQIGRAGGPGARLAGIGRQAAGRVAASPAGQVAARAAASKPAQVAAQGAKFGGQVASYPLRHPVRLTGQMAVAQAPLAVASGDPGGELQHVLEGKGVLSNALGAVGGAVSSVVPSEIGRNLVQDLFDLPAQTPPAIYMPLAGLVEAAQGDPERLDKLWNDYKAVGLLPAIASGNPDKVLEAIKSHPLFAGLEARGAQAVIGRTAGAVGRRMGRQGLERAPLEIPGQAAYPRSYSRDAIERQFQVAADRRRGARNPQEGPVGPDGAPLPGVQRATPRQVERIQRERVDRIVAQEEGVRRAGRQKEIMGAIESVKASGLKGLRDLGSQNLRGVGPRDVGASLVTQGIILSPETFGRDIRAFRSELEASQLRMRADLDKAKTSAARKDIKVRLEANEQMRKGLDKLLDSDPEVVDAIFAASEPNARALQQIDRELAELGVLPHEQGLQARLIPFARAHMGAEHGISNKTRGELDALRKKLEGVDDPQQAASIRGKMGALAQRKQIIDRNGNALKPEAIMAEMKKRGGDPERVGFVSQSPTARGAKSFYRVFFPDRQTLSKAKRSGKATMEGTFDPAFDAIVEQRIRGRGIVDAVRGFDRTVQEIAISNKRYSTAADVRQAAERFEAETGMAVEPVRLAPLRAKEAELRRAEAIFEGMDPANQGGMQRMVDKLLDDAVNVQGETPGPFVLVPKIQIDRMREHFQASTTLRKAAQVMSSAFKGVVLPTSPNWLLGNLVDVSLRTALSGTGPYGRNAALGRRLVREAEAIDPIAAARMKAGLIPGSIYGAAEATRIYRDARQFAGTRLAPLARAMGTLARAPGPRQVLSVYGRYRDAVFHFNTKFVEDQAQYAMLGKAARAEVRARTGKWESALKLGDDAIHDLAKGLLETPAQIKFAKKMEETLGQWTANSPDARAFLVDYMPFGMWTRAASKFVLMTLPAKHPIKTAIAAIAYEMTEPEREALGLSHFAEKALPPNLQGSIPLGGGAMLAPQTVSSFGFFADYQASLAASFLPQFPLDELAGLDFTKRQLTNPDGTPVRVDGRVAAAFLSMSEAYIPFLAMGKRIAKDGPTAALPRTFRPYDPKLVEWLKGQSNKRLVPVDVKGKGGSASSNPYEGLLNNIGAGSGSGGSSGGSSSNPYLNLLD